MKFELLDSGSLRLIDVMPAVDADGAIVSAARVSYAAGTKATSSKRALLRYLMRNRHNSPFEMVEFKFHVKAPIFVARQWFRHRTGSFNEVSARYSILPDEVYSPAAASIEAQAVDNKQGRQPGLTESVQEFAAMTLKQMPAHAFSDYNTLIELGVARELARMILPVSTYTEFIWKVDLLNLMKFIQLRADSHAQYEIRVYAEALAKIVEARAPLTFEAFNDYWLNSVTLSAQEWAAIKGSLTEGQRAEVADKVAPALAASEFAAFVAKLAP
jgi:thymidylate synthase (FAD)